jgi:hypothetical protein
VSQPLHRVEKPWGYELWWARTDRYVGKQIHINKGHALSLQYHNRKDETIFVWSGKILFEQEIDGQLVGKEMGPGDAVHVTPPTVCSKSRPPKRTMSSGSRTDMEGSSQMPVARCQEHPGFSGY